MTANVRTIRGVPLRLRQSATRVPRLLPVRGEVLMRRTDFAVLNARLRHAGQPLFANPRNAAAGSVRQLDPRVTAGRALHVCFYDVIAVEGAQRRSTAVADAALMHSLGLPLGPHRSSGASAADVLAYLERMARTRESLDVEIDGIVAKIDSLAARTRLGNTARHPRWAIGVKFAARTAVTRLERIDVQVGRTGVLTPVAMLRPVEIGGVTVTRATLHNWHELERRGLRPGDTVEVERAGDVIPEVIGRIRGATRVAASPRPPARCPACHARVVADGPFRRCTNTLGCPAQRVRAIEHFASRDAFDIDGLGPSTIEALVAGGLVRTPADLFPLTDDDLRGLPRFGAAAANRLAAAIGRARHVPLDRLLFALGISGVGRATAIVLAERFGTLTAVRHATLPQLAAVAGVGPATGRRIHAFFARPSNQRVVDALLHHGVTIAPYRRGRTTGAGTVVFTGVLEAMARAEATRLVEQHGGRVGDRVTRTTDIVVAGSRPGAKLRQARQLQIPVVDEDAFLRRYLAR